MSGRGFIPGGIHLCPAGQPFIEPASYIPLTPGGDVIVLAENLFEMDREGRLQLVLRILRNIFVMEATRRVYPFFESIPWSKLREMRSRLRFKTLDCKTCAESALRGSMPAFFQFLAKIFDLFLKTMVGFQLTFNNPDGMKDGGMVTVETLPDYLQGRIRISPRQINGDLSRTDNGMFAGAGDKILGGDAVMFTHKLFNDIDGNIFTLPGNVLHNTLGKI